MLSLPSIGHWHTLLLGAYFSVLGVLSFYGLHRYVLVYLYRRYGDDGDPEPAAYYDEDDLPHVTVQLPLYNERYVVERLIRAVCDLNYPQNRLHIQVLDDSTDDTTSIAGEIVDELRRAGFDIELIHREERTGYKAGALANGLEQSDSQFVAVFDADFVPDPDFLRETIHYFNDDDVGMVQARWEHINRDYSLLTRAQAILLDGHFVLEHTARNRSGRFFNFNGTAGIWRRRAIREAGGWSHDTLTEDLDLSYRAQLQGWEFVFLRDVTAPCELPVDVNAFKNQQHRWAKGSIQTALKLLPDVLRDDDLRPSVKYEACYHLTANLAYPLMVALAALMPTATFIRVRQGWYAALLVDLPIFIAATFSICYFYWVSQREIDRRPATVLTLIPAVLGLGIGISVNNTKAVWEAIAGIDSPFVRTPKYAIKRVGESWASKLYIQKSTLLTVVELSLGLWITAAIVAILLSQRHGAASLPFLLLFQFGFFYVGVLSVGQSLKSASPRADHGT